MKKKWDELSLEEQAEIMKVAVRNGIYDLYKIRDKYNEFAEGGSKGEEEEVNTIVPFTQKTEVVITPDTEYNQYLNTLPDNQRFTPNDAYDSYLYWKLNGKPRNFGEAYDRDMFTWDSSDNSYHANSIAFGDDGVGYFMKPKTHDTVGFETDWYNKGLVTEEGGTQRPMTPEERAEWLNFRSQYSLINDPDRPNYYRYQPINKHSLGGPLVEAAMNEYRNGGGIHIKKENRGKFTRLKERTGHSATWFKEHGTPAQRKMATFALNARKWKHGLGGNLFDGTSQSTQKMQIGLDVQGWPDYSLEEIVAYGNENERRRKAIQDAYLNFVTESNDATAVANGRLQNQHLVDRAIRGARANAAWEEEHPNLTAWSYLPSAAVIGTALAPLGAAGWSGLTALGDAAAATSTGQAITAGLAPLATAASTSVAGAPLYTWADVGMSSLFGGHGVQTAIDEGGISPITALDLTPFAGMSAIEGANALSKLKKYSRLEKHYGGVPHKEIDGTKIYMDDAFPTTHNNHTVWASDDIDYARNGTWSEKNNNTVFDIYSDPKNLSILETPEVPEGQMVFWQGLPYKLENGKISYADNIKVTDPFNIAKSKEAALSGKDAYGYYAQENKGRYIEKDNEFTRAANYFGGWSKVKGSIKTDDVVKYSRDSGYDATRFNKVYDGGAEISGKFADYPINELIFNPGAEKFVLPHGTSKWNLFKQLPDRYHMSEYFGLVPLTIPAINSNKNE